ncbi:MAG TPA: response regulator transcription factor [Clostridiaceae bacterium]|nr:response regulator transcription factor [Clostridiaceae bacterium]
MIRIEKKILIVEDDNDINQMIKTALTRRGYSCRQAYSGTEALMLARQETFAVMLLDLMLPGLTGEEVLRQVKNIQDVPVLVISAKDSLDSKLELLTSGADDYLTKPFNIEEMAARVDILARRFQRQDKDQILKYRDLVLYTDQYRAELKNKPLPLTRSEFHILELLLRNPKRVFSKQSIYEYAWEESYFGGDNTINVHISNIRKKIKSLTDDEYIDTVWGIGFKLKQ